jgi:hypothetical protein
MVELVDTQDLKSCARQRRAGSIPAPSTKPLYMPVERLCYFTVIRYLLVIIIAYHRTYFQTFF